MCMDFRASSGRAVPWRPEHDSGRAEHGSTASQDCNYRNSCGRKSRVSTGASPILTLEPLIEAVRQGLEAAGWALSGLQKTTSHEYAGRWDGESSRSAYLFFHRPGGSDQ